jgi:hypothetical protein
MRQLLNARLFPLRQRTVATTSGDGQLNREHVLHARLRRVLVLALAFSSAVALGVVEQRTAHADITNWSITPSPNLSGRVTNDLGGLIGVACVTANDCMAVGGEFSSTATQTLVEYWDGTGWSILPSPNQGSYGSQLDDVSCTSASSCTAVGFYLVNSGGTMWQTLIESWNGTSWSIVPSPNAGTQTQSLLVSVSCTSATFCVAVGTYQTLLTVVAQQTLVESWNGTAWSVVSSPDPNAADNFSGVSCASASFCVAVGTTYSTIAGQTLIESWDGTSWSAVSSPDASTADLLNGVTCTAANNCVAVGLAATLSGSETLVESWDGTSWSIVSSPNQGTSGSQLRGVTCLSAAFCQAVGYYLASTTTAFSLVEAWDGTSWSIVSTPNTGAGDFPYSVSCVDTSHCEAVGESRDSSNLYSSLVLQGLDGDLALSSVPNITVNATGPSGAAVTFAAPTSTDEETPPPVTCDHTSGSTYPIGTTTVGCSATDSDDAPSTVTASFTVTVQGATAQLSQLLTYVTPLPPGQSLSNDVKAAINDITGGDPSAACSQLKQLISLANAQAGKKLTTAQAAKIVAAATQIEAVLGC